MKIDLDNNKGLNSGIAAAMRQADAMQDFDKYASVVSEGSRMDEIKRAAGLISPAMEELRRIVDVPDYMKTAIDKMNLVPDLGVNSYIVEETKRMNEMKNMFVPPAGITSIVQKEIVRQEQMNKLMHFPVSEPVPVVDYSAIRPMPDPMRETNKNLKETKALQAKMAEHLEELVSQAKGTTDQNVKMIKLSTASLVFTVVGIVISTLVGILSYQAGKSSSVSTPMPAPVVKAATPVLPSVPALITPKK